jgi:hypothetical protein
MLHMGSGQKPNPIHPLMPEVEARGRAITLCLVNVHTTLKQQVYNDSSVIDVDLVNPNPFYRLCRALK